MNRVKLTHSGKGRSRAGGDWGGILAEIAPNCTARAAVELALEPQGLVTVAARDPVGECGGQKRLAGHCRRHAQVTVMASQAFPKGAGQNIMILLKTLWLFFGS
jgi:hypothetical protein